MRVVATEEGASVLHHVVAQKPLQVRNPPSFKQVNCQRDGRVEVGATHVFSNEYEHKVHESNVEVFSMRYVDCEGEKESADELV